ncbi:MAG: DUF411 domain-containing protein [Aquificaceae bacterium]|nr:DUF411 domain-containing protein [Aquificaceae bacterium]
MRWFLILFLIPLVGFCGEIIAYYSPSCSCCTSYFSKLEEEGFKIRREKKSPEELMNIKSQLKIPPQLRSCHTMVYKGRFIEGHVPPEGVKRLIKDEKLKGVASLHGKKSALGGFEDNYYLVRENQTLEVKP